MTRLAMPPPSRPCISRHLPPRLSRLDGKRPVGRPPSSCPAHSMHPVAPHADPPCVVVLRYCCSTPDPARPGGNEDVVAVAIIKENLRNGFHRTERSMRWIN